MSSAAPTRSPRPVRSLAFDFDGVSIAFESEDYAWLGYVSERFGGSPGPSLTAFVVSRVLEGRDPAGGGPPEGAVRLVGNGFEVMVTLDTRRAAIRGARAEEAVDPLLDALLPMLAGLPVPPRD